MARPRKHEPGSVTRTSILIPIELLEAIRERTGNVSAYLVELAELDLGINPEEIINHQIMLKSNRLLNLKEAELNVEKEKAELEARRASLQARRARHTDARLRLLEKVQEAATGLRKRGYEESRVLFYVRERVGGWRELIVEAGYRSVDDVLADWSRTERR